MCKSLCSCAWSSALHSKFDVLMVCSLFLLVCFGVFFFFIFSFTPKRLYAVWLLSVLVFRSEGAGVILSENTEQKNFAQHVFAFAISLLDSLPYLFRKIPCLMHMQNEIWPQGWLWIQTGNSIVKYLSVKSPEGSIAAVFWLEHAAGDSWGDRKEHTSWILYKEEGGQCGLLAFSIALSCILTVWVVKGRLYKVALHWTYSSTESSLGSVPVVIPSHVFHLLFFLDSK